MSEKSLGQIAYEAYHEISDANWHMLSRPQDWERAAQAVVDEILDSGIARIMNLRQMLKAEGAAEERERIADWLHSEIEEQLADEVRSGEHEKWLRAGGKS